MSLLVTVTLAIFLIASVLYQVKRLQKTIGKFDKLKILPNYSFFAPKPYVNDYRLVFKIISDSEADVEWTELPMYKNFDITRMFWNPFKYYNKGMIDSCHHLLAEFQSLENKTFIKVSYAYIGILSAISKYLEPLNRQDETIRFAILASENIESTRIKKIVFVSFNQKL